jgi:hypothetical protein
VKSMWENNKYVTISQGIADDGACMKQDRTLRFDSRSAPQAD